MSPFVAPLSRRRFTPNGAASPLFSQRCLPLPDCCTRRTASFAASATAEQGAGADDFERADGPLGADWVADRGAWSIVGGSARSSGSPGNDVATYRPVQLGSRFEVHNHHHELSTMIDGRPALEVFAELLDPSVALEVDLYWATAGGADPVELLDRLGDRVIAVHVKDGRMRPGISARKLPTDQRPAGQGDVPLAAVLAADTAIEYAVIEFDHRRQHLRGHRGELPVPELDPVSAWVIKITARGRPPARWPSAWAW